MPFLTGLAQLAGASEEEIEEAIAVALGITRDSLYLNSLYLNGISCDPETFMGELAQVAELAQSGD